MIIFSKIKAKAKTGETWEGLTSGVAIPKSYIDLEGWKGFELFLMDLDEGTLVEVDVQVFGYGEGEKVIATPEEVAYMYKRIEMRADFLESRCVKLDSNNFSFEYLPSQLFTY